MVSMLASTDHTHFIHGFVLSFRNATIANEEHGRDGWTRQKLATRSGMTPQYVSIVEQGGNVPSLTTVLELIEVLGGDVGDVMRELAIARVIASTRASRRSIRGPLERNPEHGAPVPLYPSA